MAQPNSQTAGFFEDCLILADDFRQYYLGGYTRTNTANPPSATGVGDPVDGWQATFGGPVVTGDNPLNQAGLFQPTSDVLPVGQFPQFASHGAVAYPEQTGNPFKPIEGERYAGAVHEDASPAADTHGHRAQCGDRRAAVPAVG